MTVPLVSIALVTRNGAATLPAVFEAIARQEVDFAFEVVAVDSDSTDGSAALLARSADRVKTIAPRTFNHGLTRNLAIEQTRGELVVLLVQDAVPASSTWLASLVAPLRADDRVAGAFARQLPRPEAGAVIRHYLNRAPVAESVSRTLWPLTPDDFEALPPMDRMRRCTFDNVCSCIRRSVWRRVPFRATPIAEDLEWAKEVLLLGHRLEFAADATVTHSHERSVLYEFDRTFTLHCRLYELFGLRTIPTLPLLARAIASSLMLHLRCQRGISRATIRAAALAVAWPLGQYLGGRAGKRQTTGRW